jgi:hypothetical protein
LIITDEKVIPLVDKPPRSTFKGYEEYIVQELSSSPVSSSIAANAGRLQMATH